MAFTKIGFITFLLVRAVSKSAWLERSKKSRQPQQAQCRIYGTTCKSSKSFPVNFCFNILSFTYIPKTAPKLDTWKRNTIDLFMVSRFSSRKKSAKVESSPLTRITLVSLVTEMVPWSDINSTGKFLSPRRLEPIFTCLTAFNCNKIYTIGKPNIFSIC